MEHIPLIITLTAAVNLMWIVFSINTRGFYTTMLFKVVPTASALALVAEFAHRHGWIIQV